MLRESVILVRSKMIMDLLLLVAIVLLVQSKYVHPENLMLFSPFLLVLLSHVVVWFLCARAFGLYGDLREKPFSIEWVMFLKAFGLYSLIASFVAFQLFGEYPYGKHQFLLQCSLVFLLLPVQKVIIRVLFKKLRNTTDNQRKVLIVGTGKTGLDFYHNYVKNRHYGCSLAGFVDNHHNPVVNGHYLGKTSDIDSVIAKHDLDDVIVTIPITQKNEVKEIVEIAQRRGKRVRIIANYEEYDNGQMAVDKMGNLSMITFGKSSLDDIDNKIYKRLFDICFSFLVIVLLFSWLFPLIAAIIKLTSKGPVFFRQERWGINNKTISCLKFRTMVASSVDVDENGKYKQACKNDPRITPIGRILRKTSLDELPQFINVLLGSMSVIGPRPHPVPLNLESKDTIERYLMRHWVKPGISGWAQVHGFRGETKDSRLMRERVNYDIWYIENWTFWLDLQITVQTVVNIVKGEENAF